MTFSQDIKFKLKPFMEALLRNLAQSRQQSITPQVSIMGPEESIEIKISYAPEDKEIIDLLEGVIASVAPEDMYNKNEEKFLLRGPANELVAVLNTIKDTSFGKFYPRNILPEPQAAISRG